MNVQYANAFSNVRARLHVSAHDIYILKLIMASNTVQIHFTHLFQFYNCHTNYLAHTLTPKFELKKKN